ncbi:MAG TPA: hypothetical protein VEA38_10505 [Terriglobales bacterium]|nr:hypothetical protein [Terriglobales bacterium]
MNLTVVVALRTAGVPMTGSARSAALLREPFSWTKLAAVALIAGGIYLLQREGL